MELRLPPIRALNLHDDMRPPSQSPPLRDERLQKVLNHCQALCAFADHYASAPPPPNPPEVAQMVDRAVEVITILQEYRQATFPPAPRAPKRPWEDATDDATRPAPSPPTDPSPVDSAPPSPATVPPAQEAHMSVFDGLPQRHPAMDEDAKAVAIRDMEDIRARRTQGQAAAAGKTKYKKRSRATPPGHCHSCEISDTPEWRRGPDGQRTLCNACGLHYAKLVRKRDRIISALPAGGQAPPPIDIAFLRKSARLAAENSALARSAAGRRRADKDKKDDRSPPPSPDHHTHATAPPATSPRAPVMGMTLPPPQRYYPAPPPYQPYVQSGPVPSYGPPPTSSWGYDTPAHHPGPAPAPPQWDHRYMPHPR